MIVIIIVYIFLFHFIATQRLYGGFMSQAGTSVGMLVLINDISASILTYNTLRKAMWLMSYKI